MLVKTLSALILLAVFGLTVPVQTHAQADNNAARIAAQKRNAKLSHKQEKAQKRAMRKAQKAMGKPHRTHNPPKTSDGTMPS